MKIGLMQLEVIVKRIIFNLTMDIFEDMSDDGTGTGTGTGKKTKMNLN